ncbi:MAG: arabinose efflux permease [uncultured archaeon A07HB70]|nr:MAG: arabinose efflux permease [uncultured archaeon A07HB70]
MSRDGTRTLFGTLCLLFALTNLGRTAFAPLAETLRVGFDASPAAVGVVVSLAWAGSAGGRPVSAYLVTRLRRERVVALAGVVLAVGAALAALAPSLAALRIGAFVAGLSSGVYIAAAVPLVGDLFPEGVGRALGVHGAAAQVAAVAAPGLVLAAALLADWRAAFWVLAVVGALAAVGVLAVARAASLPASTAPDPGLRAALSHPRVLVAGVAVVSATGFVWQGVFNFYVTYLVTERGFATGAANGALSLLFAAGIPGMAVGGRLADRLPTVPLLIALVVTFALAVVGATLAGTAGLLALSTVASLAVHALFPSLDTYVLGALPAPSRASAYAVFSGVALTLEAPGSAAVGVAATRVGLGVAFRAFALALLPVAAGLVAAYLLGLFPPTRAD